MAIRTIITLPHSILRKKSRKVTNFGPELQTLIDDLLETMRNAPGVGLAAPQVDVPLRVFVAEWGDDDDEEVPPKTFVFINPEITRTSDDTSLGVEGCLSIPNVMGEVRRPQKITIKGQNRHGQALKIKASGWLARILQHEFDHLNGVLFVDIAESVWQQGPEDAEVPAAD